MSHPDRDSQLDRIERRQVETIQLLLKIQRQLGTNTRLEIRTMSKIDDALTHIQGLEDANDSAITLLGTLVAELKDAKDDPAKLDALIARIDADKTKMAAAVVANTPADAGVGDGSQPTG